jgi:hypothetical protein
LAGLYRDAEELGRRIDALDWSSAKPITDAELAAYAAKHPQPAG